MEVWKMLGERRRVCRGEAGRGQRIEELALSKSECSGEARCGKE